MSYSLSFLKHPFLPATEKPRFFNSRRKPFLLPQQKTHGFAKKICSRNRKTMAFELSSVARLTPEGPGGEPPVYELGKAIDWGPDTLFPQRSRNSPATQLGGGAPMAPHGAIFHEPYSANEEHIARLREDTPCQEFNVLSGGLGVRIIQSDTPRHTCGPRNATGYTIPRLQSFHWSTRERTIQ